MSMKFSILSEPSYFIHFNVRHPVCQPIDFSFLTFTLLSVTGDLDMDNVLLVSLLCDVREAASTPIAEFIEAGFEVAVLSAICC